jgi:hypothetical protein
VSGGKMKIKELLKLKRSRELREILLSNKKRLLLTKREAVMGTLMQLIEIMMKLDGARELSDLLLLRDLRRNQEERELVELVDLEKAL